MKETVRQELENLLANYPELDTCKEDVENAFSSSGIVTSTKG